MVQQSKADRCSFIPQTLFSAYPLEIISAPSVREQSVGKCASYISLIANMPPGDVRPILYLIYIAIRHT